MESMDTPNDTTTTVGSNPVDIFSSDFTKFFMEYRKSLRQILREFVDFMSALPVKEDGINYFFCTVDSLSRKTFLLEDDIGIEKTHKLFHRISKDQSTKPLYHVMISELYAQFKEQKSQSVIKIVNAITTATLGEYYYEDALPRFRKLCRKKEKLLATDPSMALLRKGSFVEMLVDFPIGDWSERDVVKACTVRTAATSSPLSTSNAGGARSKEPPVEYGQLSGVLDHVEAVGHHPRDDEDFEAKRAGKYLDTRQMRLYKGLGMTHVNHHILDFDHEHDKPAVWRHYVPAPDNNGFDAALCRYELIDSDVVNSFRQQQPKMDNLCYDLKKLVNDSRLQLADVNATQSATAKQLICLIEGELKNLSNQRHTQLGPLPAAIRCMDNWLEIPIQMVQTLIKETDVARAAHGQPVGQPTHEDPFELDVHREEEVQDAGPEAKKKTPGPKPAVDVHTCPYCTDVQVVFEDFAARDEHFWLHHPIPPKVVEDEGFQKQLDLLLASAKKNVTFDDSVPQRYMDIDEERVEEVTRTCVSTQTGNLSAIGSQSGIKQVRSTLHSAKPESVTPTAAPTNEATVKSPEPQRGTATNEAPHDNAQAPVAQEPSSKLDHQHGVEGLKPGGLTTSETHQPASMFQQGLQAAEARLRKDWDQPPNQSHLRSSHYDQEEDDRLGQEEDDDDWDDDEEAPFEPGIDHDFSTVLVAQHDARAQMLEKRLKPKVPQEDKVVPVQPKFNSLAICPIFNPDKIHANQLCYVYRKFMTDWDVVDARMEVLNLSPLFKYHTLRRHLRGKALMKTYVSNPKDMHYHWALNSLEKTFDGRAHKCTSLFADLLSLPLLSSLEDDDVHAAIRGAKRLLPKKKQNIRHATLTLSEPTNCKKAKSVNDVPASSMNHIGVATHRSSYACPSGSNNEGSIRGKKVVEQMGKGMPTHPSNTRLCPVCGGLVGFRHQYILQCPKLKTMSSKEARTLFLNMGSKCQKCYSRLHSAEFCDLQNIMCRAQISTGHRKGQVCGSRMHHSSLHSDAKAKREAFSKMNNNNVVLTRSKWW